MAQIYLILTVVNLVMYFVNSSQDCLIVACTLLIMANMEADQKP